MPLYILIPLCVVAYFFLSAFIAAKHYARTKPRNDTHRPSYCFGGTWCDHATASFFVGAAWFVMLPILAGFGLGSTSKETRTESRRRQELEEAAHKAELARYARVEDEELTRQLEAQARQRSLS